jgi:outer membrane protein assembly factor BamD (BamD/ComL family)
MKNDLRIFYAVRMGVVGLTMAWAVPDAARAQGPDSDPADLGTTRREIFESPRRKTPNRFFGRPSRQTPEEQWEHARELREAGSRNRAARAFRALVHEWHDSPYAPRAQQAYAEIREQNGSYPAAFGEYQYLIDHFPGRAPFRAAYEAQMRIANHIMRPKTDSQGKSPASRAALPLFRRILLNAPQAEEADQAAFHIAVIHEESREWLEAADAYEKMIMRYGSSPLVEEALARRAHCLYREATRYPRDENGLRIAHDAHAMILDRSRGAGPEFLVETRAQLREIADLLEERHYRRAAFYDRDRFPAQAAVIAYSGFLERFPASARAEFVKTRIRELQTQGRGEDNRP